MSDDYCHDIACEYGCRHKTRVCPKRQGEREMTPEEWVIQKLEADLDKYVAHIEALEAENAALKALVAERDASAEQLQFYADDLRSFLRLSAAGGML